MVINKQTYMTSIVLLAGLLATLAAPAAAQTQQTTAASQNQAPYIIGGLASQYDTTENITLRVRAPGIDPDGDPISFSVSTLPAGATYTITGSRLDLEWRPPSGSVGTYPVSITVSDGLLSSTYNFNINVQPDDNALQVTLDTPQGTTAGQPWDLHVFSPVVRGAPFALVASAPLSPGVFLPGIYGTSMLEVDPATMVILLDGFSPNPAMALFATTPVQVSGTIPAGLTGLTFNFQAIMLADGLLFLSAPATVSF